MRRLVFMFILVVSFLFIPHTVIPVHANDVEPSINEVFDNLGFAVTEVDDETFPEGLYEITLYAEFSDYYDKNELSYYEVYTSTYNLIFAGPEGSDVPPIGGYLSPPITKTIIADSQFGISLLTPEGHRYFTENWLNPDWRQHAKVYKNQDDPGMFLIGIENLWNLGDMDFQDIVFSLQRQPSVILRSEWNARFPSASYTDHTPFMITIHHTDTPNIDPLTAPERIRQIQDYHMDDKGWIDIGYHYIIDKQGNIYEGRPSSVVGAHVGGYNTGNIGIAVLGNYDEMDINDDQLKALRHLVAFLCQQYDILATDIYGHRDFVSTICPGDYLYNRLNEIKNSPYIESDDTFDPGESMTVYGAGYAPNELYWILIVEDTTWTDGMAIPSIPQKVWSHEVFSDEHGLIETTIVWPSVPGKYDVIVDVNNDGIYHAYIDALDDRDIIVTAGFFVVPELPLGTVSALLLMLAALTLFKKTSVIRIKQ